MQGVWAFILLLFSVSTLNGRVLLGDSSNRPLHKVYQGDRWAASFTNPLKEGEKVGRKGRWIELTPVSSPLAATKEQMLTLGLKIAQFA